MKDSRKSNNPLISVVMAVYNGSQHLAATIDSVLNQKNVVLEFIIVDDGSEDSTANILLKYSKLDSRVRIITQENRGLTLSLIQGCKVAKGKYIARQDCGDTSALDRLNTQQNYLNSHPNTVMVSAGVVFSTSSGEELYQVIQSQEDAEKGLKKNTVRYLKGPPHHGSVMFRRSKYKQVGGYRKEFVVAQDLDLWIRLVEYGKHCSIQEIHYYALVDEFSISSQKRKQQIRMAELILRARYMRKQTGSDVKVLSTVESLCKNPIKSKSASRSSRADFYYFIGSCVAGKNATKGREYLRKSLALNPFNFKTILKLFKLKYL